MLPEAFAERRARRLRARLLPGTCTPRRCGATAPSSHPLRASCAQRVAAASAEAASRGGDAAPGSLAALAPLLPAFLGVAHPYGAAGGTYLRLRDATAGMALPCVADIKVRVAPLPCARCVAARSRLARSFSQLGFCTGEASFGAAYAAKCAAKDARTTSRVLGFRVAGAQHWTPDAEQRQHGPPCWRRMRLERAACAALDEAGARAELARFVSCGGAADGGAVVRAALPRLAALADWLHAHRGTRFFGASVLLLFDAAPLAGVGPAAEPAVDVKARAHAAACAQRALSIARQLVDFAHVAAAHGSRDDNVLGGLRALTQALQAAAVCARGGGGQMNAALHSV